MSIDAPIIVTGMHRSGTSATANILQCLGVYLGNPEHLFQGDRHNPKGYFEHQAAVSINDRLLEEVGAAWDLPPLRSVVPADVGTELISSVRRSVASLRDAARNERRAYAIKDPRVCLTWPIWVEAFPDSRFVICLRNPIAVAHSLRHRGFTSYRANLRLIHDYFEAILSIPATAIAAWVDHERLLSNRVAAVRELATDLELSADEISIATASTVFDGKLVRSPSEITIPGCMRDLEEVWSLYRCLLERTRTRAATLSPASKTAGDLLPCTPPDTRGIRRMLTKVAALQVTCRRSAGLIAECESRVVRAREELGSLQRSADLDSQALHESEARLGALRTALSRERTEHAASKRLLERAIAERCELQNQLDDKDDDVLGWKGDLSHFADRIRALEDEAVVHRSHQELLSRENSELKERLAKVEQSTAKKIKRAIRNMRRRSTAEEPAALDLTGDVELIRASKWFDSDWYLRTYPDVAEMLVDPATHFLEHGAAEGRDPGPHFDTLFYLSRNEDVARSGANPLLHFIRYGQHEGRQPKDPEDPPV